jgi:tRNA(fMet)-specific endonuclease VapC
LPGYLLDTNMVSALMASPDGQLALRIARAGEANVFTSVIVAAELRYGAVKKQSRRLVAEFDGLLRVLEVRALEPSAAIYYGQLRALLEAGGTPSAPTICSWRRTPWPRTPPW